MTRALVPSNHRHQERALAAVLEPLQAIDPSAIDAVWDAWRCPTPLLPVLAWALSVDLWEESWSDVVKREAIAASPAYHRLKGTRGAIETILAPIGPRVRLVEWFEQAPEGRRGTARIFIESRIESAGAELTKFRPRVHAVKPKARSIAILAGERVGGNFVVGGGILEDSMTHVRPHFYPGETVSGQLVIGAGLFVEEFTIIERHSA